VRCQDTKQGCNFKKKGRAVAREADEVSEEMLAEVRGMRADVKEGLDRMAASLEAIAALGAKWWDREEAREPVGAFWEAQPARSPTVVTQRTLPSEAVGAREGEEIEEVEMVVDGVLGLPVAGPSRLA